MLLFFFAFAFAFALNPRTAAVSTMTPSLQMERHCHAFISCINCKLQTICFEYYMNVFIFASVLYKDRVTKVEQFFVLPSFAKAKQNEKVCMKLN